MEIIGQVHKYELQDIHYNIVIEGTMSIEEQVNELCNC